MAGKDTHRRDCNTLLGKPYTEVHEWLDITASILPPRIFDTYHRIFRHHVYGLNKIRMIFGDEAVLAGRLHILRDLCNLTEMKGGIYILNKRVSWVKLKKGDLNEQIRLHDIGAVEAHDWRYVVDQDEAFLVSGQFIGKSDIEKMYPELHKEIKEL